MSVYSDDTVKMATIHNQNTQPNIPAVKPPSGLPRGRILLLIASVLAVIIISVAVFKAILPGELSGGYLYSDNNSVVLLQITNNNGSLLGEVYSASKSNGNVSQFSTSLTGEENNGQVDIILSIFGFGSYNIHGTYDGRNLHIEIPNGNGGVTEALLSPASIDDYNNAVHNLQQQAANEQATAAVLDATATEFSSEQQATADAQQTAAAYTQNEQNALNYDLSTISSDTSQLQKDSDFSSILQSYQTDIKSAQSDWQNMQNDANAGCAQLGGDYAQINGSDAAQIAGSDDASLRNQVTYVQSDISQIQNAISDAKVHYANLGQSYDFSKTNGIISNAQSTMNDAKNQGTSFDNQMNQIQQQASALLSKEGCQ